MGRVRKCREGFLWYKGLRTDKLYFYLITLGTGSHLVYQARPACSSMSNLDMGDYRGRTWLSPPTAYPSTMGNEANEGNL